jgi:hypothetical protein
MRIGYEPEMFPDLRMKLRLGGRFAQFARGRIRRGGHDGLFTRWFVAKNRRVR